MVSLVVIDVLSLSVTSMSTCQQGSQRRQGSKNITYENTIGRKFEQALD